MTMCPWLLAFVSWNTSVMNYTKISNNCVCNKPDQATSLWLLECIFRAGLEQEIENLKKKLSACTKENLNLQEELSEAYRIKGQLADLHSAEVTKNMEAEKQVKFFQGCVAAAFAERDHAVMEAEKAKEKEELVSNKLSNFQKRVEELTSDFLGEKRLRAKLQINLEEQEKQNDCFKKVIDKFYELRQNSLKGFFEDTKWEEKCECLLHDSEEMWSFNDCGESSTSKYINALEEQVETLRKSVDNLQSKLQLGFEIENHLKKKVAELEKKKILSEERIEKGLSGLIHHHARHKLDIMNLLDEGLSHIKSVTDLVEEKLRPLAFSSEQYLKSPNEDVNTDGSECQDVHANSGVGPALINKRNSPCAGDGDASEALAQALQEKVATLLLLSQQEERHLLERNVNSALQKKMEELKRSLLQVTNEKVRALMELAQMKQEYQVLQEKISHELKQGKLLANIGERTVQDAEGRLKNLLKKTYLNRWIGTIDSSGEEAGAHLNYGGNFSNRKSNCNIDFARMRIENATLKESLGNMEHLTSSVRRLRLSLIKVKDLITSEGTVLSMLEILDNINTEAKLLKTALGSSLPVSWSAEADLEGLGEETIDASPDIGGEKVDFVSAAGFEMVETLVFASQLLKDYITKRGPTHDG